MLLLFLLASLQETYRPTECYSGQCTVDLADAKEGRWVSYVTESSGSKVTQTVKVLAKAGDDWMIEQWYDLGNLSYGFLFRVNPEKKVTKAWGAAQGDSYWSPIPVKEPPKMPPRPNAPPKPETKLSEERKSFNEMLLNQPATPATGAILV